MVRVDAFIFGYRRVRIAEEELSLAASLLLRAGIISTLNSDGTLTVRERDVERVKRVFGKRISYEMGETQGVLGFFRKIKNKKSILFGALIGIVLAVISSNTVWDIRVLGNEKIPDAVIVGELDEIGFSVGDLFNNLLRLNVIFVNDDVAR